LIQVEGLTLIKCKFNQWFLCRQCCRYGNMSILVAWI